MNEKKINWHFIAVVLIAVFIAGTGAYFFGRADQSNSGRIGDYTERERELLSELGEYQRREAERIERERARIARTEKELGALRELDRRSGDLYQELREEANILADYFRGSRDEFDDYDSSPGGE